MKKILPFAIIFIFSTKMVAQQCLPGVTFFSTQQQVDAFPASHPDCSIISGSIWVSENTPGGITNLDSLRQIEIIEGFLQITENSQLDNLNGLNNLAQVGGFINIDNNASLNSIAALNNLNTVEVDFQITSNAALLGLEGLNNLSSVGLLLNIYDNHSITDLDGLYNLTTVQNMAIGGSSLSNLVGLSPNLSINGNLVINATALYDFNGLENITIIGGALFISDNPSLTSFNGLESLSSIGGDLVIDGNDLLTDLDSLNYLLSIDGSMVIRNNLGLNNLEGLKNINPLSIQSTSGLEDIEIYNNPMLSSCAVQSICDALQIPETTVEIYNNTVGCNDSEEITFFCTYTDQDNDGFYSDVDCDDENIEINPGAVDIPNNGIDEDCDGEDYIVSTTLVDKTKRKVFPNPTDGIVYVQFPISGNADVKITDCTGRTIFQDKLKQDKPIDLSRFPQGVYVLLIQVENGKQWQKIIVKSNP